MFVCLPGTSDLCLQRELMRMNSELDAKRRAAAAQRRKSAAAAEAEMERRVAATEHASAPPAAPGTPPRQASPVDTRQRAPLSPHVRAAAAASASKRTAGRREGAGARAPRTDPDSGPGSHVSPSPSRIPVGRGAHGRQRGGRAGLERSPVQGADLTREAGGGDGGGGADPEATIEGAGALGLEAKVRYQRARLTVLKDERARAIAEKDAADKEANALRRQLSEHEQEKVKLQRAAQAAETEAKREKKRAYVRCLRACGMGRTSCSELERDAYIASAAAQAKLQALQAQMTTMRKELDQQQREVRSASSEANSRDVRLQRALAEVRSRRRLERRHCAPSPACWAAAQVDRLQERLKTVRASQHEVCGLCGA